MKHFLRGKLKGVFAFFATMLVAVSLAPTAAFAADFPNDGDLSITAKDLQQGDQVTIYKVVDSTYDEATNNFEITGWAEGIESLETAQDGLKFDTYKAETEADKQANANKIAQAVDANKTNVETHGPETAGENGIVVFNNLTPGQYLITVTPANAGKFYQHVITSLLPEVNDKTGKYETADATVQDIKSKPLSIEKKVSATENGTYSKDVDTVSRGGKVYFKVTTSLPMYAAGSKDRTFSIDDDMSKQLTLDGNVTVKVDNKEVMADDTTYTANGADITFKNDFLVAKAGKPVEITYAAKIGQDATFETAENNKVTLTYSTDSYTNSTKPLDATAYVTVYKASVKKVDSADKSIVLFGAEFELYTDKDFNNAVVDSNGKTVTLTTGKDGMAAVDGLGAGTYYLKEIKAPTGYVLSTAELPFVVDPSTSAEKDWAGTDTKVNEVTNVKADLGNELPKTGGPGTIALTVAGVVVMAGAACFVVRSRKQN